MPQPLARLYDLALRGLDDHERRADALRGRLGPVLAAAALGVTLLSGPLVADAHTPTVAGKLALVVAVCGLLVVVGASFRLLSARRRPVRDLDVRALTAELQRDSLLEDHEGFYEAMILRLTARLDDGADAIVRLARAFTVMLWGILVMLCGLALAALIG